jgi:hypothetical protein
MRQIWGRNYGLLLAIAIERHMKDTRRHSVLGTDQRRVWLCIHPILISPLHALQKWPTNTMQTMHTLSRQHLQSHPYGQLIALVTPYLYFSGIDVHPKYNPPDMARSRLVRDVHLSQVLRASPPVHIDIPIPPTQLIGRSLVDRDFIGKVFRPAYVDQRIFHIRGSVNDPDSDDKFLITVPRECDFHPLGRPGKVLMVVKSSNVLDGFDFGGD